MSAVEVLPRYSGATVRCAKCGQRMKAATVYQDDSPYALGRIGLLNGFRAAPRGEYLYRRCAVCHYEWAERTQ